MPQSDKEIIDFLRDNIDSPEELFSYVSAIKGFLPNAIKELIFPGGNNILHKMLVISRRVEPPWESILALLYKLTPENIETLILMLNAEGETPYQSLLNFSLEIHYRGSKIRKQNYESFFREFMGFVNDRALNAFFSSHTTYDTSFFSIAFYAEWSKEMIELVISRLNQDVLRQSLKVKNEDNFLFFDIVALREDDARRKKFPLGLAVINCMGVDLLMEMLRQVGPYFLLKELLQHCNVVGNAIVRKILDSEHAHVLRIAEEGLFLLEQDNLNNYIALHPEINIQKMKGSHLGFLSKITKHKSDFQKRLFLAESEVDTQIIFVKQLKYHLKEVIGIPIELTYIIVGYSLTDVLKPMLSRMNFELTRQHNFIETLQMKSILHQVMLCFSHDKKREQSGVYGYNESLVVLDYLFDCPEKKGWAIWEFNRSEKSVSSTIQRTDEPKFVPLFSKMKALSLTANKKNKAFKKLTDCKKALASFLSSRKHENDWITRGRLEKEIAQANREYQQERFEKMLEKWSKHIEGPFAPILQKIKLIREANRYGYQCKNMPGDGNCFFHAIADQLTQKGLSSFGDDDKVLRARTMDYLIFHIEEFQSFLDEYDGDINEFIDKNMQNKTCADHLIIMALSRAINMTIVVIRSDGASPTVMKQRDPNATLYIGYEVGQHYQSLIRDEHLSVTAPVSLEELLREKKADGAKEGSTTFLRPLARPRGSCE